MFGGPITLFGAFLPLILVSPWWVQIIMPVTLARFTIDRHQALGSDADLRGGTAPLCLAPLVQVVKPAARQSRADGFALMLCPSFLLVSVRTHLRDLVILLSGPAVSSDVQWPWATAWRVTLLSVGK